MKLENGFNVAVVVRFRGLATRYSSATWQGDTFYRVSLNHPEVIGERYNCELWNAEERVPRGHRFVPPRDFRNFLKKSGVSVTHNKIGHERESEIWETTIG